MELKYKRKYEELQRCLLRIKKLYNWKIINEKWEDSFHSPKDLILNFFRTSYELKENLKLEEWLWWYHWIVETFCKNNNLIWLSLDIANFKKHWKLDRPKTDNIIWEINTGIHLFDPNNNDRTELKIEINWKKEDGLYLVSIIFKEWTDFLLENKLI